MIELYKVPKTTEKKKVIALSVILSVVDDWAYWV